MGGGCSDHMWSNGLILVLRLGYGKISAQNALGVEYEKLRFGDMLYVKFDVNIMLFKSS